MIQIDPNPDSDTEERRTSRGPADQAKAAPAKPSRWLVGCSRKE